MTIILGGLRASNLLTTCAMPTRDWPFTMGRNTVASHQRGRCVGESAAHATLQTDHRKRIAFFFHSFALTSAPRSVVLQTQATTLNSLASLSISSSVTPPGPDIYSDSNRTPTIPVTIPVLSGISPPVLLGQASLGAHSTLAGSVKIFVEQTPTSAAHGGACYCRPSDVRVAMAMSCKARDRPPNCRRPRR